MSSVSRLAALLLVASATGASAAEVRVATGIDLLLRDQSHAEAFHTLTLSTEIGNGLSFGKTLLSAARGDAGGSFLAGFTVAGRFALAGNVDLEVGGTVGGGGGVWVVDGDGLMTRAHASIAAPVARGWSATLGVSHLTVSGAGIRSPALSFGIAREVDFAATGGHGSTPERLSTASVQLQEVKSFAQRLIAGSSRRRDGRPLADLTLLGGQFVFSDDRSPRRAVYFEAAGAALGEGGGYAHWMVGKRWSTAQRGPRLFATLAGGFGGGGGVDTGPGAIVSASGGASVPLSHGLAFEAGVAALRAPWGDLTSVAPYAAVSLAFGDADPPRAGHVDSRHRWTLSFGLTSQRSHPGFRKAESTTAADPVLIETSLDYHLSDQWYLLFDAQTAAAGDAGGYAVGQVGLGHSIPINEDWALSLEGFLGAAGGDGVDTGGGLIGGARADIDYLLPGGSHLYLGLGKIRSQGGARPVTVHAGVKMPFSLWN